VIWGPVSACCRLVAASGSFTPAASGSFTPALPSATPPKGPRIIAIFHQGAINARYVALARGCLWLFEWRRDPSLKLAAVCDCLSEEGTLPLNNQSGRFEQRSCAWSLGRWRWRRPKRRGVHWGRRLTAYRTQVDSSLCTRLKLTSSLLSNNQSFASLLSTRSFSPASRVGIFFCSQAGIKAFKATKGAYQALS
jgi:hypothetical protein